MPSRKTTIRIFSILTVGGLVAAVPTGVANASPTAAHRAQAAAKAVLAKPTLVKGGKVIVVLKDQHSSAAVSNTTHVHSAAVAQTARSQVASVIRSAGGAVHANLSIINAVAATVTTKEATALAQRSDVAEVIPDARIQEGSAAPTAATPAAAQPPTAPVAGACPTDPTTTALGPEALEDTHADSDVAGAQTARSLGYTGAGVTVAFMAEGIDINNPDFMRDGKSIFSDYQDFSGDGTAAPTSGDEAFLDASAIAAQGNVTYNLKNFSALGLTQDCKIRIEGEAPGVNLVGIKVFSNGFSSTSGFLQGIDYAVNTDHVNVLSQSFGSNPIPATSEDVIQAADSAAVAAGVTVTVSSGDAGITNTIGSPASDPDVISVGASTTFQAYLQTGYGGARLAGITGWKSDNISSLSSSGFDTDGQTVTLVAPGDINFAACTADATNYFGCADFNGNPSNIEESGGTSESAPTVAGVAALVIEAYRSGHNNASPTPAQVRRILTGSADDIDAPAEQQGAGLVDAYKAVQLAKAYGGATPTGSALENSLVRFHKNAAPRTPETVSDTLTNDGTAPQTITTSGRTIGVYKTISTGKVTLSDASSPKYVDFQGITDNLGTLTFTVPAGQARLSASIAYQAASGTDLAARDRLTLVDPNGDLVGYSLPQGIGNYGHAEVAKPVAGTWTAYITSRDSADGGSEGPVQFAASVAKFKTFGKVTPATLTLAPGKSGVVTMHVGAMTTPGDLAGSLVLSSTVAGSTPSVSTIPVTLRTEIPAGTQKFEQTLTGPNGRDEFPGDVYSYTTTVGKNVPELNAAVRLNLNPNNQFEAALVSPDGNVAAFATNSPFTTSPVEGPVANFVKGVQLHTLAPVAGSWKLLVYFAPVVSGTVISTPFTVSTDDLARVATAAGLPDSKKTVLKAGQTTRYYVKIENKGASPESYFIDGRLNGDTTYSLASFTDSAATAPVTDNLPDYVVPSNTVKIGAAATTTGTNPIQFDMESPLGDPDIESSTAGSTVTAFYGAGQVTPGSWDVAPSQVGPYPTAATPEDVDTAMVARTRAFDPAVTSSTGDVWLTSLDPSTTVNTVTVDPGDTAVIQVKITPTKGKHSVAGTLFVDDADLLVNEGSTFPSPNANEVAAINYRYSVLK